ncbi:DUF6221 family protein [Actinomadura sp. 6K520]|jgi:hypothetical protein|uniref:DUF6221 family protein n=1 Tax=Actinomadura sp. 6K520 TaxID=2530364 RepID=UPI0010460BEF|nr:DUF6221 family protein [Actinomadura sp. 6K520]TDE36450.1 hypothetical protein E1289_06120 [Actinomadura sp. 6K520]
MDLVEFLRARLARDEQIARDCSGLPWQTASSGTIHTDPPSPQDADDAASSHVAKAENGAYAEHIARHDPARTLAQVAAVRQIVDDYEKQAWILDRGHRTPELEAAQVVRENVLRRLALPYASHPAYRDDWRP